MSAQETWDYRPAGVDGDDKLLKIDIASDTATPVPAGPGVKLMPAVLPSGTIAYLRRDKTSKGVFYGMGTPGPAGSDLRTPSWSRDGSEVVYSRFTFKHSSLLMKQWSRNKNFEMYATAFLPAYDPSGEYLAVTKIDPGDTTNLKTNLFVLDEGKPEKTILTRNALILAPSWSPDSKQIAVGVGEFTAFLDFEVGSKKPVDPVNGGAQVAILGTKQQCVRVLCP